MNGVIVIVAYRPKPGKEKETLELVRSRVPTLRKETLVSDHTPTIMRARDGTIIEVLEWHSLQARDVAQKCRHDQSISEYRDYSSRRRCVCAYSCRLRGNPLHHRRKSAPRIRARLQANDRKRSRRFHLHQTRRAS